LEWIGLDRQAGEALERLLLGDNMISFPANPTPGQQHTTGGVNYVFQGGAWRSVPTNYEAAGAVVAHEAAPDPHPQYSQDGHTHDAGEITGDFEYLDINPAGPIPAHQEGRVFYDPAAKALSYYSEFAGSSLQIGQEQWVRVRNTTGAQINDGEVVKIIGASGQTPTIAKANATTDTNSATLGVATMNIADNAFGLVTVFGVVNGQDTSAWAEGTTLYLSADTAGAFSTTIPAAPAHPVTVATVIYQHATQGKLFVRILAAGVNDDDVTVDAGGFSGFFDGTDISLHTILNKMDVHHHDADYEAAGAVSAHAGAADPHAVYALASSAITAVTYNAGGTTTIALDGRCEHYTATAATGATTWAITGAPAGKSTGFVLDLTNGGSQTQNWMAGSDFDGGVAPTLTAAGKDRLVFQYDGATWSILLAAKDFK
jgi:hypothetical protein